MSEENPLLKRAVDDREAHPWRYYRLDHDVMKRMLDQQATKLEQVEAQRDILKAAIEPVVKAHMQLAQWISERDGSRFGTVLPLYTNCGPLTALVEATAALAACLPTQEKP